MRRLIFVDTSAWVAAFVDRDQHHEDAAGEIGKLLEDGRMFLTTDYVFDETVTRLRYEGGHDKAVQVGEQLLASRVARVVDVGRELRSEAWRLFKKCKDQELSFTDCTSFATMRKFGLTEAFTFDGDFQRMGFLALPRKKQSPGERRNPDAR